MDRLKQLLDTILSLANLPFSHLMLGLPSGHPSSLEPYLLERTTFMTLPIELRYDIYDMLLEDLEPKPLFEVDPCTLKSTEINYMVHKDNGLIKMLATDTEIQRDVIYYLLRKGDVYLSQGRAAMCFQRDDGQLGLFHLPIAARENNGLQFLPNIWLLAGKASFSGFASMAPFLTYLRVLDIDHDMTYSREFKQPRVFVVDYCSDLLLNHYPKAEAQKILILESKIALQVESQVENHDTGRKATSDVVPFLRHPARRLNPGLQIIVHLRCPMLLCSACTIGGTGKYFKKFTKRMVSSA